MTVLRQLLLLITSHIDVAEVIIGIKFDPLGGQRLLNIASQPSHVLFYFIPGSLGLSIYESLLHERFLALLLGFLLTLHQILHVLHDTFLGRHAAIDLDHRIIAMLSQILGKHLLASNGTHDLKAIGVLDLRKDLGQQSGVLVGFDHASLGGPIGGLPEL